MLGSVSAIDGASAELRGGRIALVDRDGSNDVDIVRNDSISSGRVSRELLRCSIRICVGIVETRRSVLIS